MIPVTPDDQPYCGAELLPHATWPDGSPAPIVCTSPVHGMDVMHHSEQPEMYWQWQDADGNWLRRPATDLPA
jgi:hypothetical protein